jgi:hypothetical protein
MGSGNGQEHLTKGKQLGENLSRRLAAYTLAATATAGLGLTAAAAPTEASIISHTTSLNLSCPTSSRGIAQLDLGITKSVQLTFQEHCTNFRSGALLVVGGPVSLANASTSRQGFLRPAAARLGKGSPIQGFTTGPAGVLAARGCCSVANQGNWFPSSPASTSGPARARGYLGFEFGPKGGEHVGWVAMSVVASGVDFAAHITGYAYDTVPGQTIKAGQTSPVPEPPTLSLLALGAAGLIALRKRKLSATSCQARANH